MKKHNLQTIIGISVSILLIYLVLFDVRIAAWFQGELDFRVAFFGKFRFSLQDLRTAAGQIRPLQAVIAVSLLVFSLLVRGIRWKYLISPVGKADLKVVFWSNTIGYLMNNVLPLRAGELIRGLLVARLSGLSAGSVVTTVVLERMFDLVGLGLIFGVTLTLYDFPGWMRIGGAIMSTVIIIAFIIAWLLSRSVDRFAAWVDRATERKARFLEKLGRTVFELIKGLAVLRSGRQVFNLLCATLLLWIIYALIMKSVLDAFQFTDGRYPLLAGSAFLQATVITIISSLGISLPSAPGAVGTYHGAIVLVLRWFEVPEAMAVIYAATAHAMNYLTTSIMGLLGLWQLKISWGWIMKQARGN